MLKIIRIREVQFETMMRYRHSPIRTAKVKIVIIPNVGRDAETLELSCIAGENAEWYRHSENNLVFWKTNYTLTTQPKTGSTRHLFQ